MAAKLPQSSFASLPPAGKAVLLVAVLALLSGGYYVGLQMGLEQENEDAQRQHSVLTNDLNQARERQKEYLRLREELAAREAADKQNMRVLPETAEIPAFLDDLNRLAELSGLRVANVGPKPEASEQFFVRVPVSLNIAGKFHQLTKFFYNVSRLERAINMENISLTQPTKDGEDLIMNVSVLATTFRRPDGAGATK
ncbi:MAG TPA: type 4a pilus biogenesis protein PilO [Polyangiales bacterium]|jgi:type IV pilus assembly protein PilO|nr:type 4a pilus biogenesis protein PilO [Polyangiales bacterium]